MNTLEEIQTVLKEYDEALDNYRLAPTYATSATDELERVGANVSVNSYRYLKALLPIVEAAVEIDPKTVAWLAYMLVWRADRVEDSKKFKAFLDAVEKLKGE